MSFTQGATTLANTARSLVVTAIATACVVAGGLLDGAEAAFPGVNGRIVFESTPDGARNIFVMNSDGSGRTQLTAGTQDAWPDWSPDGTKIAFDSRSSGTRDIWVMNPDGSGKTDLTGGANDTQPAWSPDGQRIAFARQVGLQFDIFVMDADGTDQVNVTPDGLNQSGASWSPDGTRIAFTQDSDIWVMNADGSGRTQLTTEGANSLADWSPDGSKIAFHRNLSEVYVMNADGSGQTSLGPGTDPSWSPDGTKIAFVRNDPDGEIHIMDADGSDVVKVTDNDVTDGSLDWGAVVDSDGDGVPDDSDAFPDDPSESADSDDDGLGDNGDPDTVGDAVDALPMTSFGSPGHRVAIRAQLDAAEAAIHSGDGDRARRTLESLRTRIDGCETGPSADRDDWIIDCADQNDIRALLDALLATLP